MDAGTTPPPPTRDLHSQTPALPGSQGGLGRRGRGQQSWPGWLSQEQNEPLTQSACIQEFRGPPARGQYLPLDPYRLVLGDSRQPRVIW